MPNAAPDESFPLYSPFHEDDSEPIPAPVAEESEPQLDDIKRVFHPHSERPTIRQTLQEYLSSQARPERRPPTDSEPWSPFRTRLDFEVSEFAQEVMLNRTQINTLISLIRRCAANIDEFSLHKYSDMDKQWELASKKCTQVNVAHILLFNLPILCSFRNLRFLFSIKALNKFSICMPGRCGTGRWI